MIYPLKMVIFHSFLYVYQKVKPGIWTSKMMIFLLEIWRWDMIQPYSTIKHWDFEPGDMREFYDQQMRLNERIGRI